MGEVSIPEALGISALGLVVVFVVLVFLMCITYILAAIFKSRAKKTETANTKTEDEPAVAAPIPETVVAEKKTDTAAPAAAPVVTDRVQSVEGGVALRKYKVLVNGIGYMVDAESAEAAPAKSPAGKVVPAAGESASSAGGAAKRKYNVIVNGVSYTVDAESDVMTGGRKNG